MRMLRLREVNDSRCLGGRTQNKVIALLTFKFTFSSNRKTPCCSRFVSLEGEGERELLGVMEMRDHLTPHVAGFSISQFSGSALERTNFDQESRPASG